MDNRGLSSCGCISAAGCRRKTRRGRSDNDAEKGIAIFSGIFGGACGIVFCAPDGYGGGTRRY